MIIEKEYYLSFWITLITLAYTYASLAQVGINTTTPTETLDVNGTLRVRDIPTSNSNSTFLTTNLDGNVTQSSFFTLFKVEFDTATSNVDATVSGINTVNNIDLGLTNTITIPANKEALIITNYSVPLGVSSSPSNPIFTYCGIRFLIDGVEDPSGSRKSTIIPDNGNSIFRMTTISCVYLKYFPSSPTNTTITISLNGYVEQHSNSSNTYRFNMWSPTGPNFNWGSASINTQLFLK